MKKLRNPALKRDKTPKLRLVAAACRLFDNVGAKIWIVSEIKKQKRLKSTSLRVNIIGCVGVRMA